MYGMMLILHTKTLTETIFSPVFDLFTHPTSFFSVFSHPVLGIDCFAGVWGPWHFLCQLQCWSTFELSPGYRPASPLRTYPYPRVASLYL